MNNQDTIYLLRCYELAKRGTYAVAPNPMVGSVLATPTGIISEGFHHAYGEAHAEVNALKNIHSIPNNATLYVSLEPCSHFGKTPPCANLIIEKGIKRVVVGNLDPNPLVAGKGIELLRHNGILVEVAEHPYGEQLNQTFNFFHRKKSPFITLKWAQSADGHIGSGTAERIKISSEKTNQWVHQLRAERQAILVGYQTALLDNPKLDCRLSGGKSPLKFILDPKLLLPQHLHVFNTPNTVVVHDGTSQAQAWSENVINAGVNGWWKAIESYCTQHNIQSILVEGGQKTLQWFIDNNKWNEAFQIVSQLHLKQGVEAPSINGTCSKTVHFETDTIYHLTPY